MFINTTGVTIKTAVDTKHFTRILRISFSQTSLSLNIHFFGLSPDANRTQYLAHRCTRQLRLRSVSVTRSLVHTTHNLSLTAASSVARQPKDSPLYYKLCRLWAQESSLSAGHSLYRRERTPSLIADSSLSRRGHGSPAICSLYCCGTAPSPFTRCLAMGWLPHHLLAVSPWDGSLAIGSLTHRGHGSIVICLLSRRGKTSSPSAVRSFATSPWVDSLAIRSPSRREAVPAGRLPVCSLSSGRLLPLAAGHCLNSAVSLHECTTLLETALSVSFFERTRRL